MDIEQGILLEGYAQFVSKVEQRPELTGKDAKQWLMGDLMRQGFQVFPLTPFDFFHYLPSAALLSLKAGSDSCQPWSKICILKLFTSFSDF